jgi:hypothetical protein
MKKSLKSAAFALVIILGWPSRGAAQASQYVTLTCKHGVVGTTISGGNNLPVQTNQVVSVVGCDLSLGNNLVIYGFFQDGTIINMTPYNNSISAMSSSQIPQIFTGLTNICVLTGYTAPSGGATFQITTPATGNVVSNYVPADAIVIPASATGNVQIILESSPDLVNWTAASPGTYGASAGTNRFFRVRASAN